MGDAAALHARIEELESAISAALKVNKLLNVEVETYVCALEKSDRERLAWKKHAETLSTKLSKARKEENPSLDETELLCKMLEDQGRSLDAEVVKQEPTTSEKKLVSALSAKGRMAGWLVASSEITLGEVLGQGSFGTTYRATWRGATIAAKCVRVDIGSELNNFLREVEALSSLRHPNIVPFLGACIDPDAGQCWLLTEFMAGGTLSDWLYQGQSKSSPGPMGRRPFVDRLRMAYEVAQGMEALEGSNPPILHRDLKPSNVLVDGGGHARIGDFGLAKRFVMTAVSNLTGETGTYLYMAPEVMRHDVYNNKADVWSWGVMFTELLTCQLPYAQTFLTPVQIALAVAEEQLAPDVPASIPTELQVIGRLACEFNPECRPSFNLINEELGPVLKNLQGKAVASAEAGDGLASAWGAVLGRIYSTPHSKVTDTDLAAAKERLFAARQAFVRKLESGAFAVPRGAGRIEVGGGENGHAVAD